MSVNPSIDDNIERDLIDAESMMRRAGQQFAECSTPMLLHIATETAPVLSAVAKAVGTNAQHIAGTRFPGDDKTMEVQGIEWRRSRSFSRTGWKVHDYEDIDGNKHVGLLQVVLDKVLVGDDGHPLTPLEKVLKVWNLATPRLEALDELGISRNEFCTYTPAADQSWRVTPTALGKGRRK